MPVGLENTGTHHMPFTAGSRGDEFLDQVDVGAVFEHRDGDHLDAEAFGDGEVPVIAGRRAQELHSGLVPPRPRRVHAAVQQREHHDVVHELEAGVVARDQVGHRDAEQVAEDGPQLGQAMQSAVVAGVGSVAVAEVRPRQTQQVVGQVELLSGRLAAGQVQAQLLGLQVGVVAGLLFVLCLQFVAAERFKRHGARLSPFTEAVETRRGPRAPARAH